MSAPECQACDVPMKPDSYVRYRDGPRSGEQIAQKVTFGYKCSGCNDKVRLEEAIVEPVQVGW